MKHLAQIQMEFLKEAKPVSDMNDDELKEYRMKHGIESIGDILKGFESGDEIKSKITPTTDPELLRELFNYNKAIQQPDLIDEQRQKIKLDFQNLLRQKFNRDPEQFAKEIIERRETIAQDMKRYVDDDEVQKYFRDINLDDYV